MNKLDWEDFKNKFHYSWHYKMQQIIESPELYNIYNRLKVEGSKYKITPDSFNVFQSFNIDLNNLKVVIIGMSPYPQIHLSTRKACGLAFDCRQYGSVSPSLKNLYNAIENDVYNGLKIDFDKDNKNLDFLVNQGVMLTNASLTCLKDQPNSHKELWIPFWKHIFEHIFATKTGLIFILMGENAQELEKYTDPFVHHILKCEHPVAASYQKREMKHNNVFSKANKLLKDMNNFKIEWLLEDPPF